MTLRTNFQIGEVVKFSNRESSNYGRHVVVTAINPAPLLFPNQEHYRIYVPAMADETYALSEELTPAPTHI